MKTKFNFKFAAMGLTLTLRWPVSTYGVPISGCRACSQEYACFLNFSNRTIIKRDNPKNVNQGQKAILHKEKPTKLS